VINPEINHVIYTGTNHGNNPKIHSLDQLYDQSCKQSWGPISGISPETNPGIKPGIKPGISPETNPGINPEFYLWINRIFNPGILFQ
jgi:hypothetical protein